MHFDSLALSWICRVFVFTGIVVGCDALAVRAAGVTVSTSLGDVNGYTSFSYGKTLGDRFVVPYAEPPTGARRFQDPVPMSSYSGQSYDATGLPPACPQSSGLSYDEDCLYLTIYRPPGTTTTSNLPVFFWIHGGSFVDGASTDPAIEGTRLAADQKMIVVTVQYRLGLLGYLRLDSAGIKGNFGLKDVITALTYVQKEIKAYGGDASRVTLAGQSSGAELVKTLLVTPTAASLFTRAIMESAPLDFTDHAVVLSNAIGQTAAAALGCSTAECFRTASIDDLLTAQDNTVQLGHGNGIRGLRAAVSVLRPVVDGTLVPKDFGDVIASGQSLKHPVIFSTMKQEGALSIYGFFQSPQPAPVATYLISSFYAERAPRILASGLYDPANFAGDDATRDALTAFSSDFNWICSNQQSALNVSRAGHQAYLAQWDLGISYTNGTLDYTANKPAHQDDIYAVFDPYFTSRRRAPSTLIREVHARWGAYVKTGSPNVGDYQGWSPVQGANTLNVLHLGGFASGLSTIEQTQRPEACALGSGVYTRATE